MNSLWLWVQSTTPKIEYFTLENPNPEPSVVWVILNAFFFVAVVLLITMAIGVAFGGFRYWLLEKFPNNPLNGVEEDDLAQTFRLNDEEAS